MKPILNAIPTNIITGFLGAGKTTVIRQLLTTKPADEKWAVLVNEFGEVGIDGALLQADGIAVKEVAGGCMCCAVGLPSKVALNQLIKEHRPDRILIEPTGLAMPQQILRQFGGPEYKTLLDMQAMVCLVDPWSITSPDFLKLPAFMQQVALADVIVATKTDIATSEQLEAFQAFCQSLEPGKQKVAQIKQGEMPWQWLAAPHNQASKPASAASSSHPLAPKTVLPQTNDSDVPVTQLQRWEQATEFGYSCGWRFPPDWVFEWDKLRLLLESLEVPRIKGVLQCEDQWQLVNKMRKTLSYEPTQRLMDSRLEMLHVQPVSWTEIEKQLLKTVIPK